MILLDGNCLTLEDFIKVTRHHHKVALSEKAIKQMENSRKYVQSIIENEETVYGITTGFGLLSSVKIPKEDVEDLQYNLIVSHACSVGNLLEEEYVRGMLVLRINALAKGYSGIRVEVVEQMVQLLNAGIHPCIPEQGSLGASGDLSPLAHMVLVMMGRGEAFFEGQKISGKEALELNHISPIRLQAKEGLALINGTQALISIGAHALYDAMYLYKIASISSALSFEALKGITDVFHPKIHKIRNHKSQIETARIMRDLLEGSEYTTRQTQERVQDGYSLRCIPQVHGASLHTLKHVKSIVEGELNAVTDNPIILADEKLVISGGNFHGEPLAQAFDYLKIAVSELANISERRIERLVNPALSNGLPPFLIKNGGKQSGYMIVQYSAASLVSENKVLAHPASVDSIPSSANQEDFVSMGTTSARGARDIVKNAKAVLAMELLTSLQAIDLREKKQKANKTKQVYDFIRKRVHYSEKDHENYLDIQSIIEIIDDSSFRELVNELVEINEVR